MGKKGKRRETGGTEGNGKREEERL